jgi:molybdopterin converting factor small subunit
MLVSVRFTSNLSKLIGSQEIELNLPEAARIADLSQRLQELYPQHATLIAKFTFLVDEKGTSAQTKLADGLQVIALMVLSGGRY